MKASLSPLDWIRRLTRSSWLLHGYLIAMLPSASFKLHADDPEPETWVLDHTESSLQAYLDAPDGTTDIDSGSSRAVKLTVEQTTWDVMISSWGNTSIQNSVTTAVSGASVSFGVVSGEGYLSMNSGTTTDGTLWTTLQIGAQNTRLQADVAYNGISAAATLDFSIYAPPTDPEPEVWSYSHTEGVLTATLSANGSTTDVAVGEQRVVQMHAQYDSWEVWISNYGNTETRNSASSPASGASIYWSMSSGDGALDNMTVQADANGDASADFTMGQEGAEIVADVSYAASSGSTAATLSFNPPGASMPWEYDHSEGYVSTTLSAEGSTVDLAAGAQRVVTATVRYTSWDMYRRETFAGSGEYEFQMFNEATAPAINAYVNFSISGNGSISGSTGGSTDENGRLSTTFIMGSGEYSLDAEVRADVGFLAAVGCGTITFSSPASPPTAPALTDSLQVTWSLQSASTSVDVTASSSSIGVSYTATDVWLSSAGEMDTRVSSGPAIGAVISCSVASGDASIRSYDTSTDTSGGAAICVTAGSQESTIGVTASYAGQSASTTFAVPAAPATPSSTDPLPEVGPSADSIDEDANQNDGNDSSVYVMEELPPTVWVETGSYIEWEDNWHTAVLPGSVEIDGVSYGIRLRWKNGVRVHTLLGVSTLRWSDGSESYIEVTTYYTEMALVEDGPHVDVYWTE